MIMKRKILLLAMLIIMSIVGHCISSGRWEILKDVIKKRLDNKNRCYCYQNANEDNRYEDSVRIIDINIEMPSDIY